MTARQACLEHYGGRPPQCAWCANTTHLELDHIQQGTGNQHRREIKGKLEYWLQRQGYPPGYQCLCRHCHDLKSRRIRTMPPRKGSEDVHISLPTDLLERLTVLASAPGMTRSKVMEAALVQHLEQGASETLLAGLHQRLDTMMHALAEMTNAMQAFEVKLGGLSSRVDAQAQKFQSFTEAVHSLYDHEKAARNGQAKGGLLGSILRRP
jgi:predicted DNA-binding protein